MKTADRIKELCKEKGIAIYKLEKDLGFANAYISRLKKDAIPYDRAIKIAEYLGVPVEYLMTGARVENMGDFISCEEKRLLAYYRALSESNKKILNCTAKALSESSDNMEV